MYTSLSNTIEACVTQRWWRSGWKHSCHSGLGEQRKYSNCGKSSMEEVNQMVVIVVSGVVGLETSEN